MNEFWGYAGADQLSILVIGGVTAICLVCAWVFVKNY